MALKSDNMRQILTLGLCLALALGAPQHPDKDAQIVRYDSDNIGVDGYSYAYETSNGIAQQETGKLKNVGTEQEAMAVQGQFSYTGPDGVVYTISYIADENGFQPQGAHIPKDNSPVVAQIRNRDKIDIRFNKSR